MQEYFLFTFSSYLIHHEMKQMHPKTMRLDQHKVALLDKYLTIFLRLMEAHCRLKQSQYHTIIVALINYKHSRKRLIRKSKKRLF